MWHCRGGRGCKKLSGKRISGKVKNFLRSGQTMTYPSNLTDAEWVLIQSHFQPGDRRGSACRHARRLIVDAILYVVK
ncbi:MAG: transposase, partial [Methylococcaceae bacterium]